MRDDVVEPVGERHVHAGTCCARRSSRGCGAGSPSPACRSTIVSPSSADHHAEHAVRGGVLRPQVDDDLVGVERAPPPLPFAVTCPGRHTWRHRLPAPQPSGVKSGGYCDIVAEAVDLLLDAADLAIRPAALERLDVLFEVGFFPVLAQRVAGKALPQQDAAQVGMARRSGCPSGPRLRAPGNRRQGRPAPARAGPRRRAAPASCRTSPGPPASRVEVVDHLHLALGQVVDAGDRRQVVVAQTRRAGRAATSSSWSAATR